MSQKQQHQHTFFCKWCKEFVTGYYEEGHNFCFCPWCNNYGVAVVGNLKEQEWFRDGKKGTYFADGGMPFTLEKKVAAVKHMLRGKGCVWVGSSKSDDQFERIVVTASRLEIHKHDIEEIEKVCDLELSWMRFWFNPEWKKLSPKWFAESCNGKNWEIMFVKDIRSDEK